MFEGLVDEEFKISLFPPLRFLNPSSSARFHFLKLRITDTAIMSDNLIVKGVAGTCITFSFILAGKVIERIQLRSALTSTRKCDHTVVHDRTCIARQLPTPKFARAQGARTTSRSPMASLLDCGQPILPPNLSSRVLGLRIRRICDV
jgi:hypothetical protein